MCTLNFTSVWLGTTGPVRVAVDDLSGVGVGEHLIGRPVFVAGAAVLLSEVRPLVRGHRSVMGACGCKAAVDTELLN